LGTNRSAVGGRIYLSPQVGEISRAGAAYIIAHEVGHTLEQVARESDPKILDKWKEAVKADRISISDYGDHANHEDVAEFAQVYAVCLGAGTEHLIALKKLSPARFALQPGTAPRVSAPMKATDRPSRPESSRISRIAPPSPQQATRCKFTPWTASTCCR